MKPAPTFQIVEGTATWTAARLETESQQWAERLHPLVPRRRTPITLQATRDLRFIAAALALRRLDACLVPLADTYTAAEFERAWNATGRPALLAPPDAPWPARRRVHLPFPPRRPDLAARAPSNAAVLDADVILFTSGSEGPPKAARFYADGLDRHAEAARERLRLGPKDRWLASLPFAHVGGFSLLWRAAHLGSTLVLPEPGTVRDLETLLETQRITHVSLVPTQLHRWIRDRAPGPPPRDLQCILLGGASAPDSLLRKAREHGLPVQPTYGLTEAGSQVATATDQTPPGSVGPPLAGVEIRLQAEPGDAIGTGNVWVRTPYGMRGYLDADAPGDDWIRTQDIGRLDAQGNLWILGRRGRIIHTGGHKVDPTEVEAALASLPGIEDQCVLGLPDAEWGQRIAAAVVLRDGHAAQPDAWARTLRGLLSAHKIPKAFYVVNSIPRSAPGKPLVAALAARLGRADGADVHVRDPAG